MNLGSSIGLVIIDSYAKRRESVEEVIRRKISLRGRLFWEEDIITIK